jgi:hypothetical protein
MRCRAALAAIVVAGWIVGGPEGPQPRTVIAAGGDTPLVDAARRGDAGAVRAMLARRADVREASGDGSTALHWAAHRDNLAMADALIRAGRASTATTDLGRHGVVSRLHQSQRADGVAPARGGRRSEPAPAERRDAAHELRPHRRRRRGAALLARRRPGWRRASRRTSRRRSCGQRAQRHPAVVAALLAAKGRPSEPVHGLRTGGDERGDAAARDARRSTTPCAAAAARRCSLPPGRATPNRRACCSARAPTRTTRWRTACPR